MPIINPQVNPTVETNTPDEKRQRGTGFTNINRVLGANVGAGQQMAGRIGGALQQQGQRVQQNLGQAQQQFQTGFQQARQGGLANVQAGSALAKQPGESDEAYEQRVSAQNNIDYNKIGENVRNAQYKGPMGLQNVQQLGAQAGAVQQLGDLSKTGLGQRILTRQYVAQPGRYTAGQNALDQLLISQSPEAQKQIQNARMGVANLGQNVVNAALAAKSGAEGTALGIQEAKQKAFEDIGKSVQGIQTRGQTQTEDFNKKIARMQQLLTGVDASGNELKASDITDADRALLDQMSQYGLDNVDLYMGRGNANEAEVQSVLQQIASGVSPNAAGTLNYTDPQKQALINLAQLTPGETDEAALLKKLQENQFDKSVFKRNEQEAVSGLNESYGYDKQTADILREMANKTKGFEDIYTRENEQKRDLELAKARDFLNKLDPKDPQYNTKVEYGKRLINEINAGFENAQQALLEGRGPGALTIADIFRQGNFSMNGPAPLTPDQQAYQSFLQQSGVNMGGFRNKIDIDEDARLRGVYDPYNQYGWLAFGDRSADIDYGGSDSVDPRFRGLGLTGTGGRGSGGIRTSRDFEAAANKALGEKQALKDYVLNRILGRT